MIEQDFKYQPLDPVKYPAMAAEVHSGRMPAHFVTAMRDLDPGFRQYLDERPEPSPSAPAGAMPAHPAPQETK